MTMTNIFEFCIYIIGSIWMLYVYWRIYIRSRLRGPLLFGLGLVIKVAALPISTLQQIILVIGDILFWGGLTIMATIESEKGLKLFSNMTFKDALVGNIPKEELNGNTGSNKAVPQSYLWLQVLLIIVLTGLYFFLGIKITEILQYIIISPVFIIYHILKRRGCFEKEESKE